MGRHFGYLRRQEGGDGSSILEHVLQLEVVLCRAEAGTSSEGRVRGSASPLGVLRVPETQVWLENSLRDECIYLSMSAWPWGISITG